MKIKLFDVVIFSLLMFTSFIGSAQTDTTKQASITEKANAISSRMQRELALSNAQTKKINQVLLDRFQDLSSTSSGSDPFVKANNNAMTKLSKILTTSQYNALVALHADNKKQKDAFQKKHPEYVFSIQDRELDF